MTVYLSNAFSLQMQGEYTSSAKPITADEAEKLVVGLLPSPDWVWGRHYAWPDEHDLTATSCVGHADVAELLSSMLGVEVPVNRVSISLEPGDKLVVGQYVGPRLPEGCKELPDGSHLSWYLVEVS